MCMPLESQTSKFPLRFAFAFPKCALLGFCTNIFRCVHSVLLIEWYWYFAENEVCAHVQNIICFRFGVFIQTRGWKRRMLRQFYIHVSQNHSQTMQNGQYPDSIRGSLFPLDLLYYFWSNSKLCAFYAPHTIIHRWKYSKKKKGEIRPETVLLCRSHYFNSSTFGLLTL